jgi:regulator of sirC expression with transglutaminase-like and TPR domain
MPNEPDYSRETQFSNLLNRTPDVDLQRVALEIARDEYPELEIDEYLSWFDEVAASLKPRVSTCPTELDVLKMICQELVEERGFSGNAEAFRDTRCSYLNRVIDTGRGLPITLSLVYMGIAQRLGIQLLGVASPMHFVCQLQTLQGPVYLDAFTSGRILREEECLEWLRRVSELPEDVIRRSLVPTDSRLIVMRMLNNLKSLFAQHENWSSLWKVQHRLTAMQPGNWQEQRDLGMVSLQAGRPGMAVEILNSCLQTCQDQSDRDAMSHAIDQARSLLTGMN